MFCRLNYSHLQGAETPINSTLTMGGSIKYRKADILNLFKAAYFIFYKTIQIKTQKVESEKC